ncbi:hypothetical protein J437_LFUL016388 [Ladona fulva]|uniref:Uncharacterized protein n=1 Tax=Ladona fulva TaxID=123851 RepID=A0A8K0KML3_LADFU|nr:hypothetical protein J437_LFUL016388 [Ladona fulva]
MPGQIRDLLSTGGRCLIIYGGNHNSDVNGEDDSDEEKSVSMKLFTKKNRYYFGKNRYKRSSQVPKRNGLHNIVVSLIFDDEMIHLILRTTNVILQNLREKYNRSSSKAVQDLDSLELNSLLGLLLNSAIFKYNDEDISSNFATDGTRREMFRQGNDLQSSFYVSV